jgi:hypothetical protein
MTTNVIDALNTSDGNVVAEGAARLAGYCGAYSYLVLGAAALFLVGGFVFVVIAAKYEAAKAKAEAEEAEAKARKAAAEAAQAEGKPKPETFVVSAAVAAAKGFAEALGNAKAWLAMVIIGLLLLWLAGSAPHMCVSGDSGEQEQTSPEGNNGADAGDEPGGDATDNAQAPANTAGSAPPTEGGNEAGEGQ